MSEPTPEAVRLYARIEELQRELNEALNAEGQKDQWVEMLSASLRSLLQRKFAEVNAALDAADVVCQHGVAMDVHCCGCHYGFLFDVQSCTCLTGETAIPDYWRCRTCGCLWRDNHDGTVSLGSVKQTSCATCERKPTPDVCEPLYTVGSPLAGERIQQKHEDPPTKK